MTAAGELREVLDIQTPTRSTRPGGGQATTWSNLATNVHARVQPVRGSEVQAAQQIRAPQTYLVVINYRPGITTGLRLVWGSTVLNIRSVSNRDERLQFLTMECEAGGAPT